MKKTNKLLGLFFFTTASLSAQTVVTDANFASAIATACPSCITGNILVDAVAATQTDLSVASAGISDLTGIEAFTSLQSLGCYSNQLTSLPTLPNSLLVLNCSSNQLTSLPALPSGLVTLNANNNQLTASVFSVLPNTIGTLDLSSNDISGDLSAVSLPSALTRLSLTSNTISLLPAVLPADLYELNCHYNSITSLPNLPTTSLTSIQCSNNQITSMPDLSAHTALWYLDFSQNPVSTVPLLPNNLRTIRVGYTNISALPNNLPTDLTVLSVAYTNISSLPPLPAGLLQLECSGTTVSQLPELPASLTDLFVYECPNLYCLPLLPASCTFIQNDATPLECIPNSPAGLTFSANTVPVCTPANAVQCFAYPAISGLTFVDFNNDGILNNNDVGAYEVLVATTPNNFVGMVDMNGNYEIRTSANSSFDFVPQIDPALYTINPVSRNVTTNSLMGQTFTSQDFALVPIGTQHDGQVDLVVNGVFRPGFQTIIHIAARNAGNTYIDGDITINIDPNLTIITGVGGCLQNGNSFTCTFSGISPFYNEGFDFVVETPISTALGTIIHNDISISLTSGTDINLADNFKEDDAVVVGSYDPNDKNANVERISPTEIADGKPIEYLIRFQNTGTYPADFVTITDVLNTHFDASTLTILSTSHSPVETTVTTDIADPNMPAVITWHFPGINLPDSTSNEPESHGFVHFSIRAKGDTPEGTILDNTASIVFDYNTPIITNTSEVLVAFPVGTNSIFGQKAGYALHPNPANNAVRIEPLVVGNYDVEIYNMNGQLAQQYKQLNGAQQLDIQQLQAGIYVVQILNNSQTYTLKLTVGSK